MSASQENGDDHPRNGGQETELDSRTLQIQAKRFYLDVKENQRGRFIKIAEVGAGGRKNRLLLAMSTAGEFREVLTRFIEHCATLGPPDPEGIPPNGKIMSEILTKANRRYYLDLKENQRGRFLRVSQTTPRGPHRTQIAIPAQGMDDFKETLGGLLDTYGTDDHEVPSDLPAPRSLRSENKTFYFDVAENKRGVYMRVSEVRPNSSQRSSIAIPEVSWRSFHSMLGTYLDQGSSHSSPQGEDSTPAGGGAAQDAGPDAPGGAANAASFRGPPPPSSMP